MSNNTPDYENDLYFAVGDQSDGAVLILQFALESVQLIAGES